MSSNQQSPNKLVLRNNPWSELFLSGLITIAFTVAGLVITYENFPRKYIFSCDKIAETNPSCNLRETELWLGRKQETFLEEINAAIVATRSGEYNSQELYLVMLKAADENFTLVSYNSEDKAQSISSEINGFITNKQQRNLQLEFFSELKIEQLLVGLLFLTIGIGFLIFITFIPYYRKITFDKTSDQIFIYQISCLKNNRIEYKLNEVIEVRKEEKIDKSDDSTTNYILLMSGGERISLYLYNNSKDWKSELEMVETLAAFLNLQITNLQIKI